MSETATPGTSNPEQRVAYGENGQLPVALPNGATSPSEVYATPGPSNPEQRVAVFENGTEAKPLPKGTESLLEGESVSAAAEKDVQGFVDLAQQEAVIAAGGYIQILAPNQEAKSFKVVDGKIYQKSGEGNWQIVEGSSANNLQNLVDITIGAMSEDPNTSKVSLDRVSVRLSY